MNEFKNVIMAVCPETGRLVYGIGWTGEEAVIFDAKSFDLEQFPPNGGTHSVARSGKGNGCRRLHSLQDLCVSDVLSA